jgi:hypothetical protein
VNSDRNSCQCFVSTFSPCAQKWKDDVQIFGNKAATSYTVVRNTRLGWKVYPTAPGSVPFTESDERRSRTLWHWARGWVQENATINPDHCFTLADVPKISEGDEEHLKDRDITVMVTGKYAYPGPPDGISPKGFLRVWDGTGFAPSDPYVRMLHHRTFDFFSLSKNSHSTISFFHASRPPLESVGTQNAAAGRGDDPPPAAVSKAASIAQGLQATIGAMKLPKALCGRVANAVIWEDAHWSLINEHAPIGTFLRLRNVAVRRWHQNQFRCKSHPILLLSRSVLAIVQMGSCHGAYKAARLSRVAPSSSFLPTISALFVHPQSWVTVLPETNYEVRSLVVAHNSRVLRGEYNPTSGLLPTINLGDGLSTFAGGGGGDDRGRRRGRRRSYTGTVRVLKPVPEIFSVQQLRQKLRIADETDPGYPTGMVIADLSGSITVLVSDEARDGILKLLPPPPPPPPSGGHSPTAGWLLDQDNASLFGANNIHCRATIRSVDMDGERYFVLTRLSAVREER